MSFQKNPPWQKNVPMQGFAQQMNLQQLNQMGFLHQNHVAFPNAQPMLQMNQLVNQVNSVPYPNARVNPMAFQQNPQQSNQSIQQQQQQPPNQPNQKYNPANKSFSGTGFVTKIQNDIGFIDDEVLFHKTACVKGEPKLGDLVLLEATYNINMPFKWNAQRVQVLQKGGALQGGGVQNSYNTAPPGTSMNNNDTYRSRRYSPERRRSPDRRARSRERREEEENERKRRRDERDRERSRRDSTERKTTRSPIRKPSPKRRRVRVVPRYSVQIPKTSLTLPSVDIIEMKKRYQNLYIPSDFFHSRVKWTEAFPANVPFSINKTCTFHVMNKEVASPELNEAVLDPPDADYLYSAKVMLMSTPSIDEIYKKCFPKAEDMDNEKIDENENFFHPTRLISFLVGLRGKNETMAIGGAWSKKLDGENPQSDPTVLIKTAIRTCKALTGIDLSSCTQWYRFVELYYRRSDQTKEKSSSGGNASTGKAARVETTVIFLPDISSLMPNRGLEWEDVQVRYKEAMKNFIASMENPAPIDEDIDDGSNSKEIPIITISDDNDTAVVVSAEKVVDDVQMCTDDNDADCAVVEDDGTEAADVAADDVVVNPDSKDDDLNEDVKIDPKNMKVAELRAELESRGLSSKGLKNQLVKLLEEALKTESTESIENDVEMSENVPEVVACDEEKSKDDGEPEMTANEIDMSDVTVIDEYDSTKCEDEKPREKKKIEPKKLDDKERHQIEKRYQLPENPQIVVHPSKSAKNGKFDCSVMSLSVLLDYRTEDTKEHTFEVSIFAELFNEMLTRDFGFNIFKAINFFSPIKAKEETKTEEKKETSEQTEAEATSADKKEAVNESEIEKKKNEDSDDNRSERSRSRREISTAKDQKLERPKLVTVHNDLLLSFVYFDITRCGYIFEKDLEELFFSLGLGLARSQIRKLVEKFVTRDCLYYRKLTDRIADTPQTNPLENVTDEQIEDLARGNCSLLKVAETESGSSNSEPMNIDANGGMIQLNGSVVSIQSLLEKMKRSETARLSNEKMLVDLRAKNAELTTLNSKHDKKIKDLSSDLKSVSRKLQDCESNLSSATRKHQDYLSVLQSINDRVAPIIAKNEKSRERERERERERKKESDKDKVKKEDDKQEKVSVKKESDVEEVKSESTADGVKVAEAATIGSASEN